MTFLNVTDIHNIAQLIEYRQSMFDEEFEMSVGVVLMNYGEREVKVECVNGEWSGLKGELSRSPDIPKCPNGHVLLETSTAPRLALVEA